MSNKLNWKNHFYRHQSLKFFSLLIAILLVAVVPGKSSGLVLARQSSNSGVQTNSTPPVAGKLYAWGSNDGGQLGNGTNDDSGVPLAVQLPSGVSGFTSFSTGAGHCLAMGNDGKLYAWGDNYYGELGTGTTNNSSVPIPVHLPSGVTRFTTFAAGYSESLAMGNDGKLYGWGFYNGSTGSSTVPLPVHLPSGVTGFTAFSTSFQFSLAMGNDEKLYAWGANQFGQLGNGNFEDSTVPVPVQLPVNVTGFAKFAAGQGHSLGLTSNGKLYAWGRNYFGTLGNGTSGPGTDSSVPVAVSLPSGVSSFSDVSAGYGFSFATATDGTVGGTNRLYSWGENMSGSLGNGTNDSSSVPVPVQLPQGVNSFTSFSAGDIGLALGSDGKLYSWGSDGSGALGNSASFFDDSNIPTPVQLPAGISSFSAFQAGNRQHSLAFAGPPTIAVTSGNDDGTGQTPGTLSYAFLHAQNNTVITIDSSVTTITLTDSLPILVHGASLIANCPDGPGLSIDASNIPGGQVGLRLGGDNTISGVRIMKGNHLGLKIAPDAGNNQFACFRVGLT